MASELPFFFAAALAYPGPLDRIEGLVELALARFSPLPPPKFPVQRPPGRATRVLGEKRACFIDFWATPQGGALCSRGQKSN